MNARALFDHFLNRTGRSQADWARELGVQPSLLSMVLCGQRRASLDLALKMADSSGLPIELVAQLRTSAAASEAADPDDAPSGAESQEVA